MEIYEQMLTKALDAVIGPDAMDASIVGEEAANRAQGIYNSVKAALIRREMRNTSFADEALDIATTDERGNVINDVMAEIKQHQKIVAENILDLMKDTSLVASASDQELKKITTPESTEGGGGSIDGSGGASTGGSDTSSDGDDFSMGGGMDDMGGLDDIPMS
jgi:hypothetical protein